MPPKRKSESGYQKRMKKKKVEVLIQSQRGALDKFITKEQPILVENQNVVNNENDNNANVDDVQIENDFFDDEPILNDNVDTKMCDDVPIENDNDDVPIHNDSFDDVPSNLPNIYDPRTWDGLDSKMIDLLVEKGPKRDYSIVKGPKDKFSRRFTANLYTRVLANGEKCYADWAHISVRLREHEIFNLVSKYLQSKDMLIDGIEKLVFVMP
ncbi:hypothetical protein M5689_024463 [Euphorbia peplus]|nr:hypothetical protein M5689_024463 [Euphorbia peplus]